VSIFYIYQLIVIIEILFLYLFVVDNIYRGTSDPLVKCRIKGFPTQQTRHINKNLEPVWNEKIVMSGVMDPSLSLEVIVEDHDLTRNDFMV
jgi:Ca2+-dependent lipid-binding protein